VPIMLCGWGVEGLIDAATEQLRNCDDAILWANALMKLALVILLPTAYLEIGATEAGGIRNLQAQSTHRLSSESGVARAHSKAYIWRWQYSFVALVYAGRRPKEVWVPDACSCTSLGCVALKELRIVHNSFNGPVDSSERCLSMTKAKIMRSYTQTLGVCGGSVAGPRAHGRTGDHKRPLSCNKERNKCT
jgi:hypothetical protein